MPPLNSFHTSINYMFSNQGLKLSIILFYKFSRDEIAEWTPEIGGWVGSILAFRNHYVMRHFEKLGGLSDVESLNRNRD